MKDAADPLRVLLVHAAYRVRGGEDQMVDADAAALRRAGHVVETLKVSNEAGRRAALQLAAVPWNIHAARQVSRAIEAVSPDIVHFHNTWYSLGAAAVVRARQFAPTVMTLHNYRLTCANGLLLRNGVPCEKCVSGSNLNAVKYRCYRQSAALSAVAAANIEVHQRLGTWSTTIDRFIVLNDFSRSIMVRSGIPEDSISIRENHVARAGPRTVAPSESGNFLYVGRLSEEKGVRDLVEIWRTPAMMTSRYGLTIIGEGPLADELRSEIPPGVTMTGPLTPAEVRSRMLTARALLVPSRWYENQPLVVLEAIASGLPVVASQLGALGRLVSENNVGWVLPPGNGQLWAESLLSLHGGTLDSVSANGRAVHERKFAPEVAASKLIDVYKIARQRRRETR